MRDGGFYPQSLETRCRYECALKLAMVEMSSRGLGPQVSAITESLCGFRVNSGQASQAAKEMDTALGWRSRPPGEHSRRLGSLRICRSASLPVAHGHGLERVNTEMIGTSDDWQSGKIYLVYGNHRRNEQVVN